MTMKKIRIGNDIIIRWTVSRNGEPEDFTTQSSLRVSVLDDIGARHKAAYRIDGNVIEVTFRGKDQRRNGVYALLLEENRGIDGMVTLDHIEAFELVPHSAYTGGTTCSNISIETVELSSDIDVTQGGGGTSDYNDLANKPRINGNEIVGNKTSDELGVAAAVHEHDIENVRGLQTALNVKQNVISDLANIRSGAAKGNTAVQHDELNDYYTKDETNSAISEHHDSTKQDTISDLASIRSNATDGKSAKDTIVTYGDIVTHNVNEFATASQGAKADTALQSSALNPYRTSEAQDVIDATKQDTINDLSSIRSGAALGYTAVQPSTLNDYAKKTELQAVENEIPDVIDNVISTSTEDALSAKQGKLLNDRINNVATRGRFLSLWNCVTGMPLTNPSGYPYTYQTGDFFIVNNTGATNYIPSGSTYTGQPSTTVYSGSIKVNDTIFYDGTSWSVFDTPAGSGDVQDVYQNGTSVLSSGIAYVVVPTKTSDLNNDSGYQNATQVQQAVEAHHDNTKIDVVTGKGLSTEDYTTSEKNKLAGIAAGAEVNVQSDWNQTNSSSDDYIRNKPTIPTQLSQLSDDTTHRLVTDTEKSTWSGKQDAISDLATIRSNAAAGATAYQKPSYGIPASDLANGVIPDISVKENTSNKVASFQNIPDNTHYPTEKLVKDSLDLKINEPSTEGTRGQVLSTDGNGGRTWITVSSSGISNYDFTFLSLADNTTSFNFPENQQCHRKVRIAASATLNFAVDNKACNYVRVYNSGSDEITLAIGTVTHNSTAVAAKVGPAEIKCGAGKYVEISVIYDGSDATFTASEDLQVLN